MKKRLVWLDHTGFHVRDARGNFHLHLPLKLAKRKTTEAERQLARHQMEQRRYKLPTYNGEQYVWDGAEWPADDILDDLKTVWGFTRAQGEMILEASRLMHGLGIVE